MENLLLDEKMDIRIIGKLFSAAVHSSSVENLHTINPLGTLLPQYSFVLSRKAKSC